MLVVLAFGALISQVTATITPESQQTVQTVQNADRHACALLVCAPAEKGLPGRDGRDGLQGPRGEMGNQGLQGPRGIVGPPGRMGPPGAAGEKGCQGETGLKGDIGEIGPRGIRGLQGPPGSIGPAGEQGSSGPPGEKGEKGETGPMGATGAQGPQGRTGAAGPRGDKGAVGEKGGKGDVGASGLQGPPGVQGPVGKTGTPGAKGDKGSTGDKGMKGDSGISEVNLMKNKVSILEGQLASLQATVSKFQKVAMFPDGQMVGNKVFVTNGYEGTFDDLKQKCLQAGGQLASPRNAEENAAVQQIVVLHKKLVFLGITDIQTEGKFKYLNGEAIVYSNWQSGEPNNDKGKENCVEVYVSGKWNDKSCGEKRLLLCEF